MVFNLTDFVISGLSTLLASVIATQTLIAYRRTGRDYLLNYSVGFILLVISFVILLPTDFGVHIPLCCENRYYAIESFPPRYILQTFGYILIALAYSRNRWEKQLLVVLTGLLVFLVILVLLPQVTVPRYTDAYVHSADVAVIAYVLFYLLRFVIRSQGSPSTGLVFVGFLLILFGQYTFAVHDLATVRLINLLAKTLQLLGLGTLVLAFLVIVRGTRDQSEGKVSQREKDTRMQRGREET